MSTNVTMRDGQHRVMRSHCHVALAILPALMLACGRAGSGTPTGDDQFTRRVVWPDTGRVAPLALTVETSYCPPVSRDTGCALLADSKPVAAFTTATKHVVFYSRQAGLIEFDSIGRYVRGIGARGNDPGSYLAVTALASDAQGTVTIWDSRLSRVTTFGAWPEPRTVWVRAKDIDDVRVTGNHAVAMSIAQGASSGDRVSATIADLSPKGLLGRPLASVTALAVRSGNSDMRTIPSLYWQRPVWDVAGDGHVLYVPPDTALRIEVYDPSGRPELLIAGNTPFRQRLVTAADLRTRKGRLYEAIFREPMARAAELCGDPRAAAPAAQALRDADVKCSTIAYLDTIARRSPRTLPQVSDIVALDDGGFWIRTMEFGDSTAWLMADSTGHVRGAVQLAGTERPLGGSLAMVAIADSTGARLDVSWRVVTTPVLSGPKK